MSKKTVEVPKSKKKVDLVTTGLLVLIVGLLTYKFLPSGTQPNDIVESSVKIMSSRGGGGSGVILTSDRTGSKILTNSHVCKVIENGGVIETTKSKHRIHSYNHSKFHDLCLITVRTDLGVNTKVAEQKPKSHSVALISGHPNLYPNVVSNGHFSSNEIIAVLVGFEKCKEEDYQNPDTAFICLILLGRYPVVKQYESTLVTSTIMPGSSGSGVFNSDNELVGVVFAGKGDLGYAWTVPYEDVVHFIEVESKSPTFNVFIEGKMNLKVQQEQDNFYTKTRDICLFSSEAKNIKSVCDMLNNDLIWRE